MAWGGCRDGTWCRCRAGSLGEVAVDGGPGDAEEGGDLGDGFVAGVVELLGECGLFGGELGFAAADPAAGPGGGEAVAGVGDDEFAL